MPNITSTMTASVRYALYSKTPGKETIVTDSVVIAGGANVASKHFLTEDGVVTKVTEKQLQLLLNNGIFKQHLESGFVKVHKTSKKSTKDMEAKDQSAPLVPKDYQDAGKEAPTTSKE